MVRVKISCRRYKFQAFKLRLLFPGVFIHSNSFVNLRASTVTITTHDARGFTRNVSFSHGHYVVLFIQKHGPAFGRERFHYKPSKTKGEAAVLYNRGGSTTAFHRPPLRLCGCRLCRRDAQPLQKPERERTRSPGGGCLRRLYVSTAPVSGHRDSAVITMARLILRKHVSFWSPRDRSIYFISPNRGIVVELHISRCTVRQLSPGGCSQDV